MRDTSAAQDAHRVRIARTGESATGRCAGHSPTGEAGTVLAHRTLRGVRVGLADGGERVLDARTLSDHLPIEVDFAFAA